MDLSIRSSRVILPDGTGRRLFRTLFLFCGVSYFLFGCDLIIDRPLPTDEHMEKIFRQNRATFERIVAMSDEDSHLSNIRHNFTVVDGKGSSTDSGDAGISEERWDQYRQLFRAISVDSGILRGEDGSVHFLAFGKGIAPSSIIKGYVYSTSETPRGNIKCTDEPLDVPGRLQNGFACKNLDKNWYLFLF